MASRIKHLKFFSLVNLPDFIFSRRCHDFASESVAFLHFERLFMLFLPGARRE